MSKDIIFYPKNNFIEKVIPSPTISKVPDWFKTVPTFQGEEKSLVVSNGQTNYGVKSCIPFIDTFSFGYTFELFCDIQIKNINGNPIISWSHMEKEVEPVVTRPDPKIPIYDGFHPFNFSWISYWGIKTPKGYSCLFTHPLNRTDLPFITTSGIMDTDSWGIWGNQPFALKKDWEGVIKKGTPIIQFIPFKREPWSSKRDDSLSNWGNEENIRRSFSFLGYYKKNHWSRKSFN